MFYVHGLLPLAQMHAIHVHCNISVSILVVSCFIEGGSCHSFLSAHMRDILRQVCICVDYVPMLMMWFTTSKVRSHSFYFDYGHIETN